MNRRRWLRRDDREASLDRELSFHIEERVAGMVRSGVSEEDARRRIRLEFGAAEQVKEECRDVRPARWAETLVRDIRYAWRNRRRARRMVRMAAPQHGFHGSRVHPAQRRSALAGHRAA